MKYTRGFLSVLVTCFLINACTASTNHVGETSRIKRQSGPGAQFVGSVFQIPVQTLLAVSDAVQKSFPVIQQAQQRLQQSWAAARPQQQQQQRPQRRVGGGRSGPTADDLNKLYKPDGQRHRFSSDRRRSDRLRR